jgi:hypothetical protein
MGACLPPGAPCARRIDFKVYSAAQAPFAVAYFANGHDFVRAFRWHAHNAVERARALNPDATGFRLSDKCLTPMRRAPRGWRGGGGGRGRGRGRSSDGSGGRSGGGGSGSSTGGGAAGDVVLGPPAICSCETDIFEALGLAFVPSTMRKFS